MFATISGCIKAGSSAGGSGGVGFLGGGGGEEKRLDAMNAVCVYVSAAQLVLQSADQTDGSGASSLGEQRILDLTRLFGQLRQLLSCAVCARLLNDPYAPLNNARCQHNVCRLCVRGRKALRPLCISCKDLQDFKTYVENKTMRCLLLCYKSLCEHLLGSNFYVQLSRQKAHQALTCSGENVFGVAPMPHMTTCGDIIQEGARYEDILNVFSVDLPQITTPVMGKVQQPTQQHKPLATLGAPATVPLVGTTVGGGSNSASQTTNPTPSLSVSAVTPLAPLSAPGKRVHTPSAPRLITPPAKSPASAGVNNSTTLLTTPPPPPHGTIIKLEPSSNTHLTAGHSNTHLVMTSKVASLQPQQQQHQTQFVYVKNVKCAVSEPQTNQQQQQQQHTSQLNAVQASALNNTTNNGLATLSSAPSITYVGHNTPGIVVPIVSSSATTNAPLTIASAKLQSLKRQLAQAQARGGGPISIASAVKAAGLTYTETNTPQQTFIKASSSSVPASVGSSSNSLTITASGTSTPLLVNSSNITYVNASGTSVSTMTNASTTSTATITSQQQQQQIRNPPSIKTVSNGSAMYSVLYTGVGNKITIKRKTDGDDESGQRKSIATSIAASSSPVPSTPTATTSNQTTITNQQQQQQQLQQQVNANKMNAAKRRGCRCGNATPTPGKLTCCGQRCPCYVDSKSCIGCKCRGCRNPHRPDGGKVRPVIPELACYEIQMADENPSLSPGDLQVANTLTTRTHTISASTATSPLQLTAQQQGAMLVSEQHGTSAATSLSLSSLSSSSSSSPSVTNLSSQIHLASSSSSSPSSKGATLIPFISLHPITSQQNQQQQQQTQTISSNQQQQQQQSNMLPLESVLIQNAEGKYQVVNVLTTTTPHHHQQNNSISSSIQRIHNIPQLQISSSANNNNSSNSNNHNTNHTSIVGNMTTVNIITGTTASNAASSSTIVTSKGGAGQSILLTQQQQQHVNRLQQQLQQKSYQQHQIQRLISSDIITTSANVNTTTTVVSNSTLPMQLQQHQHQQQQQHRQQQQQQQFHSHHHHTQNQQLKPNQIITMRSTTMQNNKSNNNNTSTHQTQNFTPTLFTSNASNATTITLSPIIMSSSSPNTYKTEIFSDSSESEFMNLATSAGAITSAPSSSSNNNNNNLHTNMLSTIYSHSGLVSTPNTPARITSVPSLSNGSTGSASGSTSRMSLGGMSMNLASAAAHLTPALVEVIETSDL